MCSPYACQVQGCAQVGFADPSSLIWALRTADTIGNRGVGMQTSTQTSASTYMPIGVDNSWSEEAFDAGFSIQVSHPA